MPENGEDVQKVDEQLTEESKKGKHPETVPWGQYVGVKESLGKKIDTATQKVESLEGQLQKAVKPEEHEKIKTELEKTKTELQQASDKLKVTLEKSLSEKRDSLVRKGIPEDQVAGMSEAEVDGAIKVLASYKPKPDLGGGTGGSGELRGSPMELARQAYSRK